MKTQRLLIAFAMGALLLPRTSQAADPPVDVEIADDEAQDFFNSGEAEEEEENEPKDTRSRIKKNADAMFEELEANSKGAKIKRKKKSKGAQGTDDESNDNENINQNVVNVVVVSGDKDTKAEAKADAKTDTQTDTATGESKQPLLQDPLPEEKPLPQAQAQQPTNGPNTCYYGYGTWSSWWERERGIDTGDVLLSFSTGGYGGGLYIGAGVEGMMDDTWGIKLAANVAGFDRFDRWDDHHGHDVGPNINHGDWDFFLGGRSVAPQPAHPGAVNNAFLHLEDLALTMHLGDGNGIDIVPSFGLSHFGYHIDEAEQVWNGGSIFMRAGIGAQWVYKRFFAGAELGWYPVELFRYGLTRNEHGVEQLTQQAIDDSTDRKRVTFSINFGLSL